MHSLKVTAATMASALGMLAATPALALGLGTGASGTSHTNVHINNSGTSVEHSTNVDVNGHVDLTRHDRDNDDDEDHDNDHSSSSTSSTSSSSLNTSSSSSHDDDDDHDNNRGNRGVKVIRTLTHPFLRCLRFGDRDAIRTCVVALSVNGDADAAVKVKADRSDTQVRGDAHANVNVRANKEHGFGQLKARLRTRLNHMLSTFIRDAHKRCEDTTDTDEEFNDCMDDARHDFLVDFRAVIATALGFEVSSNN